MPPDTPDHIEAHFHKSNFFRVVHADGCFGGVTPRGSIHCGFYSERAAIPLRTSIALVNGQPGPETVVESKEGLVREIEVDVVMDINTAISFHIWMRDKLEHLRQGMGIDDTQWAQMLGAAK